MYLHSFSKLNRYIRRRLRSTLLKFYMCHFKAHSNSLQSGSHSLIFGSSRYSYLLDWRQENSSVERLGIISYMTRLIRKPRRPASFVAYFRPDIPDIIFAPHLLSYSPYTSGNTRSWKKRHNICWRQLNARYDTRRGQSICFCIRRNMSIRWWGHEWCLPQVSLFFYTSQNNLGTKSASQPSSFTESAPADDGDDDDLLQCIQRAALHLP